MAADEIRSQRPEDRRFETTLAIAAPRERVWEALGEGEGVSRWFAPAAAVEPRVGGAVRWRWGELHDWPSTVEVWEPGARLKLRYDSSVEDGRGGRAPLFVDFHLTGEGGSTTLRLVHSGFGPEDAFEWEFDGISRGWPVELRSLRLALERHAGRERRLVWVARDVPGTQAAAWRELVGPGGFRSEADLASLGEGERFRIDAPGGRFFEGEALLCAPHEFTGVARNWGDAFLRIGAEDCGGRPQVWLWLAAYEAEERELAALRVEWETLVEELFGAPLGAAGAGSQGASA